MCSNSKSDWKRSKFPNRSTKSSADPTHMASLMHTQCDGAHCIFLICVASHVYISWAFEFDSASDCSRHHEDPPPPPNLPGTNMPWQDRQRWQEMSKMIILIRFLFIPPAEVSENDVWMFNPQLVVLQIDCWGKGREKKAWHELRKLTSLSHSSKKGKRIIINSFCAFVENWYSPLRDWDEDKMNQRSEEN